MTIVNLYRRYKRWNPVHPTCGAFWGIGVGLGCGVGWGPGFGPEVIGYTGAGCGAGFSVGVTLVGCGVGLPASGLTCVPCDAMLCASGGLFDFTRARLLPAMLSRARQGWTSFTHQASSLELSLEATLEEQWRAAESVRFPLKIPFLHLWLRRRSRARISPLLRARKVTAPPLRPPDDADADAITLPIASYIATSVSGSWEPPSSPRSPKKTPPTSPSHDEDFHHPAT